MTSFIVSLISFFPWYIVCQTSMGYTYAPLIFIGIGLVFVLISFVILKKIKAEIRFNLVGIDVSVKNIALSVVLVCGIDFNIGLFLTEYFIDTSVYVSILIGLIIFLIATLLTYYMINSHKKNIYIFLIGFGVFYISAATHNIWRVYSPYFFPHAELQNADLKDLKSEKTVLLYLDAMGNLPFIDENTPLGKAAEASIIRLLSDFNFTLYENAYSLFNVTGLSLPSTLNFVTSPEITPQLRMVDFYGGSSILYNAVFDSHPKDSISVYQQGNVNLCIHPSVKECKTHKDQNFYEVHLNNYSTIVRFGRVVRRIFSINDNRMRLLDTKLNSVKNFANMANGIINNDSSFVFGHFTAGHSPQIYLNNCGKSKKALTFVTNKEVTNQYYLEVICIMKEVRTFLNTLKEHGALEKYNIIILGDHGARLMGPNLLNPTDKKYDTESDYAAISHFSSFYAVRTQTSVFSIEDEIVLTQDLVKKHLFNTDLPDRSHQPSYYFVNFPEWNRDYFEIADFKRSLLNCIARRC